MKVIYFIVAILIVIVYLIKSVLNSKLSVKESFFWVLGSFFALFLAIFPKSINFISEKVGVAYPPSLLFVVCIIFLLIINFRNSKRIAEQEEKIVELGQQLSILKEEVKKWTK